MSDTISIRGLRVTGHHGVLPEERRDGQPFVVDAVLHTDIRAAAGADDLGLTVDYAEVAAGIAAIVGGEPLDLIETLAERLAAFCLGFSGISEVEVTVHKPEAPVGIPFDDVAVAVVRARGEAG